MATTADEAFDAFVRARYAELLRFGRALTGSQEEGADLLHDALAATLRRWHRVEQHDDPEGYVRRSMVNRNISAWRRRAHERARLPLLPSGAEPSDAEWGMAVWSAIRGLPPRQRTVIALRFYADLTVAQTAALMSCSEGTVKSQTSRAVAHLRRLLGEEIAHVAE